MAAFKVNTDKAKKKTKPKSFRLPEELLADMGRIAKKKGITVNNLATQMLSHCCSEALKQK